MKISDEKWRLLPLALLCFLSHVYSFPYQDPEKSTRSFSRLSKTAGLPHFQIMNVNNVAMWFRDNGEGSFPPSATGGGTVFPRGTASVIYKDGLIWGGKVFTDSGKTRPAWGALPIRAGGNEYTAGCQAGWVAGFGANAMAIHPNFSEVRAYRLRRDWNQMSEAELRRDAAETFEIDLSKVTADEMASLKTQYAKDWAEWYLVVPYGAPYIERNGIPGFQPPPAFNYDPASGPLFTAESLIAQKRDEPGVAGVDPNVPADQVVWAVYNDLNRDLSRGLWGSEPMGLEVQATLWAYNRPGPLSNVIFKRFRIINKGGVDTTGTGKRGSFWIDSMYVGQWSDPDLGSGGDDFVGCDTLRNLAFAYNASPDDAVFGAFGLPPASVGYALLGSPVFSGSALDTGVMDFRRVVQRRNLGMMSFAWSTFGVPLYPPGPRVPPWSPFVRFYYQMLRGYYPTGTAVEKFYPFPPYITPSRFPLSGDPVSGTGFIDGTQYARPPGDRRFIIASGPFSLAPGDTQEVYLALVTGLGPTYLKSVSVMKQVAGAAKNMFSSGFSLPESPIVSAHLSFPTPNTSIVKIRALTKSLAIDSVITVLRRQNGAIVASLQLFDDGVHGDELVNDRIFANSVTLQREPSPMFADIIVKNRLTGVSDSFPRLVQSIVTGGQVKVADPVVFSDNLNGDKYVNPGENIRYGFTLNNETPYELRNLTISMLDKNGEANFSVPFVGPDSDYRLRYDPANPSSYLTASIPQAFKGGSFVIPIQITDSANNVWMDSISFPVRKFFAMPYDSTIRHVAGPGEWDFVTKVVEPSQVRSHQYQIAIVDSLSSNGSKGFTLTDITTGDTLLRNNALPDELSHNVPVVHGFRIFRGGRFGKTGVNRDSSRWISSSPQWIDGSGLFDGIGTDGFNGGIISGQNASSALMNYWPTVLKLVPVEIRFDSTRPQKAYRLIRDVDRTDNDYIIGRGYSGDQPLAPLDTLPFVDVPFSAWDVSNPAAPRQLDVSFKDQNRNGVWDPGSNVGGEYFNIYGSTYDPTGMKFGRYNPGGVDDTAQTPNIATVGSRADIMYVCDLMVILGHVRNESPGIIRIQPWYGLTQYDRFQFELKYDINNVPPASFELLQNYPNPFNPITNIKFEVSEPSDISIKVYNLLGQDVATVFEGQKDVGRYVVQWDGRDRYGVQMPTGVYFYRMKVGTFVRTKKMVLIR